jgi:15-cis-phytoene synthase
VNDAAVALAYKHCERITRSRARNFYYGIALLPARKRLAMCALYAMARRIDDVGDGVTVPANLGPANLGPANLGPANLGPANLGPANLGPADLGPADLGPAGPGQPGEGDTRLTALAEIKASLSVLSKASKGVPAGSLAPGDPVLTAMADTVRSFPLPISALEELTEGCEWDLAGRRYRTFEELVEYCHRVAGTIGRLSLSIYGSSDPDRAEPLADALGVALQLTNILRDLIEDRDVMGRVYLPAEDLERFGVSPSLTGEPDDLLALICFESGRAEAWYERGLELLPLLDPRSRACTAAMAGIYRRLLDRIRTKPDCVLHGRVSLSSAEKAGVAAMALARGAA